MSSQRIIRWGIDLRRDLAWGYGQMVSGQFSHVGVDFGLVVLVSREVDGRGCSFFAMVVLHDLNLLPDNIWP